MTKLDYTPDPRWPWSKRFVCDVEVVTVDGEQVRLAPVGPVTTKRLGLRLWWRTRRTR